MKVATYVRVSTEEQSTGLSLDAQTNACREYAEREGWEVGPIYEDVQSGLDADRPGWQTLLADARRERFEAVVVYRLDRFGCDPADAFPAIKGLAQLGIKLYSASEGNDSFVQGLLLLLAQEESRRTSSRVQLVMKGLAQQGKWLSRTPIGYEIVQAPDGKGATLQLSAQAPLVRRLFQRYAEGASYADLQREAAQMGLTVNGRRVDRQRLQHLLRNPVYVGRVVYGRRAHGKFTGEAKRDKAEWLEAQGTHEAIIDEATWDRVQVRLASNRAHNTAGERTDYLLTSYVYCAHCGGRMHGMKLHRYSRKTGERTGQVTHAYRCYNGVVLQPPACDAKAKSASGPRVDEAVRDALRRVPQAPNDRLIAACELAEEALGGSKALARQRKSLETQRARHERRRINLTRDFAERKIAEDVYRVLIEETEGAIKAIDRDLDGQGEGPDATKLEAARLLFQESDAPRPAPTDDQGWRRLIGRWVDRVDVAGIEDVRVTLKPPVAEAIAAVERYEALPANAKRALKAKLVGRWRDLCQTVLGRAHERQAAAQAEIARIEAELKEALGV